VTTTRQAPAQLELQGSQYQEPDLRGDEIAEQWLHLLRLVAADVLSCAALRSRWLAFLKRAER